MEPNLFIAPLTPWEPSSGFDSPRSQPGATMFKDIFASVVNQVYESQQDVENKQYLLATGQLDDAHSLPIAEAKAALSLDVMIALRNKAMEAYNELLRMSV